eukprot:CAMPEP_0116128398 /NCGR_PEP_ID=MMETSP0329-20121206/7340_1 /TAXON_ID=697910 /ORGANISM="Pseudo-nitzschia arenysensis, Strain B593" /LENGTH=635 /DNA_ID=CAMNT_0003622537 /DNA_START=176 /DNA_END=2083 /DNA_ORIENTATION=+
MPTLKRLFQSPFRMGSPKRKGRLGSSPPIKESDSDDSTSSPTTIPTEIFNGDLIENDLQKQKQQHNDDDFKTTVMLTSSTESSSSSTSDDSKNGESKESEESTGVDADFKTTVMPSKSEERNEPSKEAVPERALSDSQMDYIPAPENTSKTNTIKNDFAQTPFSNAGKPMDDDEDDANHESPINSVVFEKHIDTGYDQSDKGCPPSQMSPLLSPYMGAEDGFNFDDYRSTVSGLTEASNFRGARRKVPPSPSNSTDSAVNKKMEDFLKTETEAIRQLLSEVDNGDDESTVVEDSMRGANEAERMAKEMEREMELLVNAKAEPADDSEANLQQQQESPGSDVFLTDIRSVIHPSSESPIDHQGGMDDESLISSLSRISPTSPRRDLFRKRSGLYRLRQEKKRRQKMNKRKLKKCIRFFLRSVVLTLFLSSTLFVANWKWNFPNQDFSSAAKGTRAQLEKHITIDPERREEIKGLVYNTTKAAQLYVGSQMETLATRLDEIKDRVVFGAREKSSYIVREAKYYAPLVAEQSKTHVMHAVNATNDLALSVGSYVWNSERFEVAAQYAKDRLEYTFTDRAAREKREEDERRLQEILEAAAATAAKEAAEQRQQLWTQTVFAGACAFVGSVATNYIWAAL